MYRSSSAARSRRGFRSIVAGVTSLLVAFATVFVASPAMAAPVYEITARWADGTPTTVASGDVVSAEWRVNVNDDAAAPSNEPVDNVSFTLTIANGVFSALPDSCLVAGVTPASSISADGKTLVCNIGTQPQGSAHVVQTAVRADGSTGDTITGTGTIDGNTAELTPIEIVNPFSMDMAWGTPTANLAFGSGYVDVDYQWTLFLGDDSEAGPDSVTYTINIGAANNSVVTLAPGACGRFATGVSAGHPWSGGTHPAEQTAPFVTTCALTPTATPGQFTLTLTGIDYSLAAVPTTDSSGRALRQGASAIASGQVTFRIATTTNTGTQLTASAPTYTAPGSGATSSDDASNNTSSKAISFPGGYSSYWDRAYSGAGGSIWDDSFRLSPGSEVRQGASIDTRNPSYQTSNPNALYGMCQVLDSRYVTFASAVPTGIDTAQYPAQYYVGDSPLVDGSSSSYDPSLFTCGVGGYSLAGGNGWTTEPPSDLSTVKAVRTVYPFSHTQQSADREGLFVYSTIKDDVAAGTDVWMFGSPVLSSNTINWNNPSGRVTDTPDARYDFTTGLRDILRIVTVAPLVEKTVDRASVRPGETANYTLQYSANGEGGIPDAVDGFTLVDTLPLGMTYVAGSASPEPVITTDGQGRQVLSWTLDGVPTNTTVPLTYRAVAGTSVAPGQSLTNTVTASYGGESRSDSVRVVVSTNGYTTIGKSADAAFIPNIDGKGNGEGSWTVTLRSFDPLPQDFTDAIDILPFTGDERGTKFSGDYSLTGVAAATGATVYYTTADPSTVSDDPADASNGAAGAVDGNTVGWTTAFTPDATAVRVIGGVLPAGGTQQFTVNIATTGAKGGDTFVNRAQARDGHTELVMRTSAPITVANYYSATLNKEVQDADGEWHLANDATDYPSFKVGDTVNYRITVTNTGQGTLTGVTITDDRFPGGAFTIDELAPGQKQSHPYSIVIDASLGDGVVNTACATADLPEDSEVPPTINCDPAGIEITGDPTHTKEIVSATPIGNGQWEIVYALTVTNTSTASTSYSLADELHFTDQVDIASAEITGSPDGVTLAEPAWDGQTNLAVATNVPLRGTDDAGYAPHVYELTVVADVPLQFTDGAGGLPATECAADGEDTDTAFNNTSELTKKNGDVEPDQACATPPSIDITKSISAGPTPNGDGTWTVTYDVVATNDGGAAGDYDISDRMTADGDLEVVSGSVVAAPDGVTPSPTWTGMGSEGSAENVIASAVSLPAGATHTYQVEVVLGLAEGAEGVPVITPCSAEPGASGGLSNTAEIAHNDLTDDASACVTVGVVTVEKSVSSGPTPNGDGTWTVVYDIVATHVGAADADYDVTDRLHFGEGIEIVDHEVRSLDGNVVNTDWTGLGAADSDPENLVAEGITLSEGESHTYQVEVTVQMDEASIDPGALECPAPGTGEAGGLGNSTTLTSNGIVGEDDVCPTLPLIELDKEIVEGSPIENGDGTWTIVYDVTATNSGQAPGDYTVRDQLQYGAGLAVVSSEITSAPDGVELNAGWTGEGDAADAVENVIASDVTIGAGVTHTYRVTVIASMDREVVTPGSLECPAPGSGSSGGFANTAELTHNGEDQADDACVLPPFIEIRKSLAGAVTPVDGQPGTYDATYELAVTNSGPGSGIYDLDDELAPGEGVELVGIQAVESDAPNPVAINGGFDGINDLRIVTDQPIAGADGAPVVHTYTVTVRYAADLSDIEVPAGDICTTPDGEALPGTLNNTATVGWNGLEGTDNECLRPGDPTLDKAIVSATPIGGGQWEVVYDLTVGNTGTEATTYDLDDELLFAPQITVDTVSVTGPEGVDVNDGFDGNADQRIATDIRIIGLDDDGYEPHVYRVTVIANVPLQFDAGDIADDGTGSPACTAPAGGNLTEQGLNNAATLTDENGGTIVDTDCAGVPSIGIVKAMDGDPVKGPNGRWTVNYTITVHNDGAAVGDYTLTDQLRYGKGIEVLSAVIAPPDGVTPAGTWTGLGEIGAGENIVTTDTSLAAGGQHVYRVTVETHLDTEAADSTAITCPASGSSDRGGFANTAGIDHNDLTDDSATCALPEWPEDVPPPLATTGGTVALGVLGAGLLLLIAGGILIYARRRAAAE